MRRRALLVASGAWLAVVATVPAFAQSRPRRIALVHPSRPNDVDSSLAAFRDEMRNLGHKESDFSIDAWWGDGRTDKLDALAAEAVARKPDILLTASSAAVVAARKATSSIPIIFATASNPVEQGFVATLQRPGGNVTGIVLYADRMTQKVVEITRELLPAAARLALLVHEPDPVSRFEEKAFAAAAQAARFEPLVIRLSSAADFDRVFRDLAARKAEAVVVPQLSFFNTYRREVIDRALKARLPVVGADLRYADVGALMGYGTAVEDNYRRAAVMVDKVLRGANPGDLPVEQPERFRLVLNAKTAKAIGVAIPPVLTIRADRVIY